MQMITGPRMWRRRKTLTVWTLCAAVSLLHGCRGGGTPKQAIPLDRPLVLLARHLDSDHMVFQGGTARQLSERSELFVREMTINGEMRRVIFAHPPVAFTFTVQPRPGSRLRFGMGLEPDVWKPRRGDGVRFSITARSGIGGEERVLFERMVDPKNLEADRRWIDGEVDLRPLAGAPVTLTMKTDPGPAGSAEFDWAAWSNPRIVTPASEAGVHSDRLLVITADTLRADHLGCYGADRCRTPVLDRLARRGIQFRVAYSQFNTTNASHCSIFTSLYGPTHGVNQNLMPLDDSRETLAEVLTEAGGVFCGAVTSVSHLSPRQSGLAQGFHTFCFPEAPQKAENTIERVAAWLERNGDAPFFLWVHLFDPHLTYEPDPPFASGETIVSPGDWPEMLDRINELKGKSEEEIRRLESAEPMPPFFMNSAARRWLEGQREASVPGRAYAGEVTYMDHWIGRLLARLRRLGLDRRTAVVFVADHGESLGEHAIYFDHRGLYEVSVRVPLIFRVPQMMEGGGVISHLVETVDILPTCCQVLGVAPPESIQGHSLLPLVEGTAPQGLKGTAFAEHADSLAYTVTDGRWKLIHQASDQAMITLSGRDELYDLDADPGETTNLIQTHPAEAIRLTEALQRWLQLTTPEDAATAPGVSPEELERRKEKLKALGYLE